MNPDEKLLKTIEEIRREMDVTDSSTTAEKLRAKIIKGAETKEGYLEIEKEIEDFLDTNPPQYEIDMLTEYICPFNMVVNAIKEGRI